MNPHVKQIISKATHTSTSYFDGRGNVTETYFDREKFAQLLVEDVVGLLQREWYTLNNVETHQDESPRDIAIRVGRKSQIIKLIHQIKNAYGLQ